MLKYSFAAAAQGQVFESDHQKAQSIHNTEKFMKKRLIVYRFNIIGCSIRVFAVCNLLKLIVIIEKKSKQKRMRRQVRTH